MNNSKYPRVLILGHSFSNTTGMGITLTNLFSEWPKDNIGVIADNINVQLCEEIRPCRMYIELRPRPKVAGTLVVKRQSLKDKVVDLMRKQYHKLGINELVYNPEININYINQIKEFNPDIVFCALGSLISMKRCSSFMENLPNSKLVLYIVDDWVNTKINTRYFVPIWRKVYDKSFRTLLDKSSGLLSICQYMSDAYLRQYKKVFYPFHNPVDTHFWDSIKTTPLYPKDIISILYVGKINEDTKPCLFDMCTVIEELNIEGKKYIFDIYSPDYNTQSYLFNGFSDCHVFPAIPHDRIPETMKRYSSSFLTLGFSKQTRCYVRLSMPTKLTEYLASGKPIILYCPEEIALAQYIYDKKCSIPCLRRDLPLLKKCVEKLSDVDAYNSLVLSSVQLAKEHDIAIVRKRFVETLNRF